MISALLLATLQSSVALDGAAHFGLHHECRQSQLLVQKLSKDPEVADRLVEESPLASREADLLLSAISESLWGPEGNQDVLDPIPGVQARCQQLFLELHAP